MSLRLADSLALYRAGERLVCYDLRSTLRERQMDFMESVYIWKRAIDATRKGEKSKTPAFTEEQIRQILESMKQKS
jgi:imidazolonepropionase-like amidohydrolase